MKPYHLLNPDLFHAKVDRTPGQGPDGDCNLWTGARSKNGSGLVTATSAGRTINFKAHRVAHWLHFGYLDDDLYCCHTCGCSGCVNPRHLYVSDRKGGYAQMRLMNFIDKAPGFGPNGDCWRFTGCIQRSGYGTFSNDDGKPYQAHRFMHEMVHGRLPDGIFACHHCDNRSCVNPAHLFAGTHQDNMDDRNAKGRQSRTRKWAKITDDQARTIKFNDGRKHEDIAADYGISRTTVSFIKSGKRWSHITP